MSSRRFWSNLFTVAPLAILGFACSDDNTTQPPDVPTGNVRLHFVHVVGADTLDLNEMKYQTAAGDTFMVQELRYYVSNVGLEGPDGEFNADNAHLVDIRRPETHDLLLTGIPEEHYHALVFNFGLDAEKNQNNALANTEENREMEWPDTWGGGYHYMKLEGRFRNQGNTLGFATHAGRFADVTRPAEHHFFPVGMLVHKNILADKTIRIDVVMDIAEWYKTPNLISLTEHDAIMDNFDKQVALEQNGREGTLFQIGFLEGGPDD
jgi:hypothetical protein